MDTGQILAEILVGGELKIHLIGVAGSGMSGIAGLLLALGPPGERLGQGAHGRDRPARRNSGWSFSSPAASRGNVADADLIIFRPRSARATRSTTKRCGSGTTMVRRADALAAILNCKKGIVVCGMHGKTTTSSMAAHVLRSAGCSRRTTSARRFRSSARMRTGTPRASISSPKGDESDGTLALYHPEHAIVLNIEEEHLDYYADLAAIEAVFNQLLSQTRGKVFFCADDANATRHLQHASGRDFLRRIATPRFIASTICTRRISSRTSASCAAASRSAR